MICSACREHCSVVLVDDVPASNCCEASVEVYPGVYLSKTEWLYDLECEKADAEDR